MANASAARVRLAFPRLALSAPVDESVAPSDVVGAAIAIAVLVFLVLQLAFAQAAGSEAGSVLDARRHVRSDATPGSSGAVLFPVVPGAASAADDRAMDEARRNALSAAIACAGVPHDRSDGVDFMARGVSGGSAGLAFALTAIDLLVAGEVTDGRRVVATGTISAEGRVGEIGSIALKAQAAERAGADVFLVPTTQVGAATAVTSSLRVIGVRDLNSALSSLGYRGCRS